VKVIIFPKNNSFQYIPIIKTTIDSNDDYVFQLNDVNDLRTSTCGSVVPNQFMNVSTQSRLGIQFTLIKIF